MQSIIDFLSFKTFISPYVLIACYFMGAFVIPIASVFFIKWAKAKWLNLKYHSIINPKKIEIKQFINLKVRIYSIIAILTLFISLEIMWRMLFEFLIAYLQIREALLSIVANV